MAPAVYRPTPGSSFCRSSAVLGIWPASSDTTWQGRGRAQRSIWGGCVQVTRFAQGKMGSQPLQPRASSTASARQGRCEPAAATEGFRNAPSPQLQHLPCCLLQTLPSGVVAKASPQLVHLLLQETQRGVNGEPQGRESTRSQRHSPPATPVQEPAASATSGGQREGNKSETSRVVLCHWGSATGSGQGLQKGQPVGTRLCKQQLPASSGCSSRSL